MKTRKEALDRVQKKPVPNTRLRVLYLKRKKKTFLLCKKKKANKNKPFRDTIHLNGTRHQYKN
jgi:hypothetical protein